MIDHVSVSVSDLDVSAAFYEKVLGVIGMTLLEDQGETCGFGKKYPEFWINLREDYTSDEENSGMHVCFRARDAGKVSAFYAAALETGGGDDGAPGLREDYSDNYYAAFVTDPDGNRIEVVAFLEG